MSGSTGFVGKNLLKYLEAKGYALTRLNLRDEHWETTLDKRSFTTYIHLAGIAHDLSKKNEDSLYYEVNYELTKQLYKCFLKDDEADLFIFFSSVKAVSDEPESIVTEEIQPAPKTVYGKSKYKAEQYIMQHLPQDKTVIILRPCMIHGSGNKGNLNSLVRLIKFNIPWVFGAFQNKRSYCSIENLCFIVNQLLQARDIKSGVYHVADDNSISTKVLVSLIAKQLQKKIIILNLPQSIIKLIAKFGDYLNLPFNSLILNKIVGSYEVSNNKLKRALNLKSLPISSKEGLIKTISHFKNE
ncbi:NAD-dependent epimerase/dehydratase family protein [Mesohalobacter salilacus]|uniref:NAD-dependent epimerase/dehydratase family protein n=1 Tax=Mesohalobacter salilacus TaxID=2491711 RepID=UPI00403EEFCB